MVTRSSLDPIEEARARVRLRYMRARAVSPGMKQVGLAAERIARKSGDRKMPAIQMLQSRWRDIAGEQLWKFCRPEKISGGKDGRVLTLRVLPQAAPMVQHQSETIRQRVSVAAGGDVTAIRLVQGPLTARDTQKPRRTTRPLTATERADLEASVANIENDRLRAAIVALGTAMLTADDPGKPSGQS
ncbi:MAG TPA: DciA family protein [Hyphomonas sp.]|nr:DUF721 domain-containing protein [Hyphomonas sp.]MCA8903612.1 DUF721 domain-containing protein [Hyphomonas sp.]MCB9962801.1 DUF721 domain-containing protein [Hyphomonas sp.]HPE47763.1 DciA family protein [Hyphomonas sp.]